MAMEITREWRRGLPARSMVSPAWLACFISHCMLALNAWFGAPAAALFMLPWVPLAFRAQRLALVSIIENAPLFILPAFALLSAAWSQYPEASIRAAVELALTMVIAIFAMSLTNPRNFLSALLLALTVVMIVGVIIDGGAAFTGDHPLEGVFLSKNHFAYYSAIQLIGGVAVAFDERQFKVFRLFALCSVVLAGVFLPFAQSAGSILFSVPAIAAFFTVKLMSRFPIKLRVAIAAAALFTIFTAIVAFMAFGGEFGPVLDVFGKNSTLTGRVYLWKRAHDYIAELPMLGIGFQAFWQIGNPGAEELWAASFVESGAGFNFHNLYLNTTVELGYAGTAILILMLLALGARLLRSAVVNPTAPVCFAIALFVFFLASSAIEALLLAPFQIGTFLLGVMWVYSGPKELYPYATVRTPMKRRAMPL